VRLAQLSQDSCARYHWGLATQAQASQISTDAVAQERWFEGRTVSYNGVDWVWFEARAGLTYRFREWQGTVWSLPEPTFHAADGTLLDHESGYGARENILFAADSDGPVWVQLRHNSYGETGSYFIAIEEGTGRTFGLADQFEPDNTLRSAKTIPVDGTVQHRLNDLADLVRFDVIAGKVYRIGARLEVEQGYVIGSVETSTGAGVLGDELIWSTSEPRYFVAPMTGSLYARFTNATAPDASPYSLSVEELELSTLAGRVTDATDGSGHAGARVTVYSADKGGWMKGVWAITTTDADGRWSVKVQPGTYTALVEDPSGRLLSEYYGGAIPPAYESTPVDVGEESSVSGVDGRLWAVCSIEGTVSVESTPVAGSSVTLWSDRSYSAVGAMTSDSDGRFAFTGLDPRYGGYSLTAAPAGGYIAAGAVAAPVATGQVSRVTIPMSLPGSISGTVTDGTRGVPLQGITVNVWRSVSGDMLTPTTVTDENGHFTISGLPTGGYRLMFTDPVGKTGPYGQIWNGTSEYAWEDPIPVLIGQDTPGIDVAFYDRLAPVTTHDVWEDWQQGPVEIALEAADRGWMGAKTWVMDPGSVLPREYTEPIMHAAEGEHTYRFWSEDGAGADGSRNVEETQTLTVRVDNTAPLSQVGPQVDGATLRAPAVVEIGVDDPLSGPWVVEWSVNGKDGSGPLVRFDEPGEYRLAFAAEDYAFNVETPEAVSFTVAEGSGGLTGAPPSELSSPGYGMELGWPLWDGPGTPADYDTPAAVSFDPARRTLYVAYPGYGSVEGIDWEGEFVSEMVKPHSWYGLVGTGVDAQGRIYGAWSTDGIAAWDAMGQPLWHRHISSRFVAADVSKDGRVWVAFQPSSTTTQIFRFASAEGSYDWVGVGCVVEDIALSPKGELFVAGQDNSVRVLSSAEPPIEVRTWSLPEKPNGIEIDPDGYVYVSLSASVRKYTANGDLIEEFQVPQPRRLACDAEGHVYVVSAVDNNIFRFVHGLRSTAVPTVSGLPVATRPSTLTGLTVPSVAGLPVTLEYSSDGTYWLRLVRGLTSPGGAYSLTGTAPSGGYMRVVAGGDSTFAGAASIPVLVAEPTRVVATVDASALTYGQATWLRATLSRASGGAISHAPIEFEALVGGVWRRIGTGNTDDYGRCSIRVAPTANTRYRVRHTGSLSLASSVSAERPIGVRPVVGRPTLPKTVLRGRSTRAYGYLTPRHTAGSTAARLHFYRYRAGRWVWVKSVSAVGSTVNGKTKYSARVTLTRSGRWRVRARHSDENHLTATSSYRYFTVP